MTDQLLLLAVPATCGLAGDWLGRRPAGRWFGGARGLGRMDLLAPGLVAGMLGTATGTYGGFLMVWSLRHAAG